METQRWIISNTFILLGFTTLVSQILFFREFFVLFQGNEISVCIVLSIWLVWTAAGSWYSSKRSKPILLNTIIYQIVILSFVLALSIFLLRFLAWYYSAAPGQTLDILVLSVTSILSLSGFCFLSGSLFSRGVRHISMVSEYKSNPAGQIYLFETIGATAGGFGLSLFLLFDAQIIVIIVFLFGLNGLFLLYKMKSERKSVQKIVVLFATALVCLLVLDRLTKHLYWGDLKVVDSAQSRYGHLDLIEVNEKRVLYENGKLCAIIPDPESAEETIHFAMLQQPEAKTVLLIGGGLSGIFEEVIKYKHLERFDYLESDPSVIDLYQKYFSPFKNNQFSEKINFIEQDARNYLIQSKQKYDVVILSVGDPLTAKNNRLFTVEFFRILKKRMNLEGIISIQLSGSENFLNDSHIAYLSSVKNTIKQVFSSTIILPGEKIHFLAGSDQFSLTSDSDTLIQRIRKFQLNTKYIQDYYLPFRLSNERIKDLQGQLNESSRVLINRDFEPVSYFLSFAWQISTQYPKLAKILLKLTDTSIAALSLLPFLVLLIIYVLNLRSGFFSFHIVSRMSVVIMGFSMLATEMLILFSFQSFFGSLYFQVTSLIAAFMIGMALGTQHANKKKFFGKKKHIEILVFVQLTLAVYASIMYIVFYFFSSEPIFYGEWFGVIVFSVLALVAGGLGGYQFPLIAKLFNRAEPGRNPGVIYAFDLAGAVIGALLVSTILFPVFGIEVTLGLIIWMNLTAVGYNLIVQRFFTKP